MNTPINTMNSFELRKRLDVIVRSAYQRRSRQLPSNFSETVDTLKADLLKYMPTVGIDTVDEAVVYEVLHDDKTPFSTSFLFQAVRKHYTPPAVQRDCDKGDLYYWTQQLRELEGKGLGHTQKATECRWWIEKIHDGDVEADTIHLLDILAETAKDESRILFFDIRREYSYLVMRKQLAFDASVAFEREAKKLINLERVKDMRRPIDIFEGDHLKDLTLRSMHCAVVDWLRRCSDSNLKPSDILNPLMDEQSYRELRKIC